MHDTAEPRHPDLGGTRRVHLIGVGGSGMSSIALVLQGMGHRVSGSDAARSKVLDDLAALGLDVQAGHDASLVEGVEIVAASTAIPPDNVEVAESQRRGLRVWRRAELLAAVCALRRTVAVAGTHGKTTTSSMLALVMRHAGMRPSMVVGGEIIGVGIGGAWEPEGEWIVVEADESDGTFLELAAEAVVVTSVEADHLDFFGSEAAMEAAFARFVAGAAGPKVICVDDPRARAIAAEAVRSAGEGAVITYGVSDGADVRVVDAAPTAAGSRFSLVLGGGGVTGPFTLGVPGLHNVSNATAALAMGHALGADWDAARSGVEAYRGARRRFELRGEAGGVTFVDDYAHLPSEVAVTVATALAGRWKRVVAVFQPHRYSRTESLWTEFAGAFAGADVVVVTDVYSAGESPRPGVSGALVVDAVRAHDPGADVRYAPTLDDVESLLRSLFEPGDLCLTMGAGDLTGLPDRFVIAGERPR